MTSTLGSDELRTVDLRDRYAATAGRVQLTGIQALARLPIDQHRRDRAAGRAVATFVSGYEGSPLAGYDLELARQKDLLDANDVVLVPGLNEESAATAVQGSQLVLTHDGATRDGVLGIWYGKAPGLDRATDALRHGNLMGAHPQGGALVLVGDDPAAKSSSVPCASDAALADLGMPYVYPADSQDVLDLGLHAVALSRASGLWVGMKIVTAVADGSSTVDLAAVGTDEPVVPRGAHRHVPTSRLLQPTLGPLERDMVTTRLRIAREYARANRLNRVVAAGPADRIGIVAAGRTWTDTLAALARMGLDEAALEVAGVRLLRVGMPWPLEEHSVVEFADGLDEILVLEEKQSFLESAIRDILYGTPGAPRVLGKRDVDGRELVPAYGELDVDLLAPRIHRRLVANAVPVALDPDLDPTRPAGRIRLALITSAGPAAAGDEPLAARAPYFCSGCPHNSSTKPVGDSLVGGGIGCHALVLMMDESQVGTVTGLAQMGGEGLQWIGMAPFTERDHYVQNLGDGTFDHSGSLAVRAAVASGVDITYRLLYNAAVAMTGGQRAVGGMGIEKIVAVLQAEGVARVIVTTEELRRYRGVRLPPGVDVWDRSRIDEAMAILAATPGVTVLVHDQECATEKRRKRKRGRLATPETRVVINERICEGCGDCGRKSNCLSVHPVETEHGRKTRIHQASCNVDYSCLEGDCPAFMTVVPGTRAAHAGPEELDAADLPAPEPVPGRGDGFGVRITGVGGTGIVTVSQVLATAGLVAGWSVRSLDQTGLAQKGGAVVSDIRFARDGRAISNKLGAGECDLYLGCDLLVAADAGNLGVVSDERTVAVVNTADVPTGHMVADPSLVFPDVAATAARVTDRARSGARVLDARALVLGLFGDDQYTNMFLVGVGFQTGALALPAAAIEEAIRLNGVAVATNLQAFRHGRLHVLDAARVEALAGAATASTGPTGSDELAARPGESEVDRLVRTRSAELVAYQNEAYARRYREAVAAVRRRESAVVPGSAALAEAVARYLFKLMAYKDEYEVARLALDPDVAASVTAQFGADAETRWNLHPPALRALGMQKKLQLGAWFAPGFQGLYRLRHLRGTPLDPFGRAHVRVVERELVEEYVAMLQHVLPRLTPDTHATAVELAALPDVVRGYEEVKLGSVATYRARTLELRAALDAQVGG
ncbi:indolepyruvate ferredoxin oxidoreductase family protein [Nocardioides zeae]|uniref:Indolepyruvate ferredoxin oxidoreductase family protein n=1 Tax=Nocardioides zeae TaxID=1457234 RepID=A0A6P0HRH1_9ACTN|nr:indolepyruvate ferredoxin oxidoreductase family protein [Nocardioides zeae]NEN80637.1 indolepyruvate ferredoxin oxidoreductase family protein [Nocardioides zeae]